MFITHPDAELRKKHQHHGSTCDAVVPIRTIIPAGFGPAAAIQQLLEGSILVLSKESVRMRSGHRKGDMEAEDIAEKAFGTDTLAGGFFPRKTSARFSVAVPFRNSEALR